MTPQTTSRELTLTRTFAAPRQLVWDAYTVPEQLAKWWGPSIMHTPRESITVDLRPGGAFRLTMVSDMDGTEYPSDMTFRQVVPTELLAYGWDAQGRGIGGGEVTVTSRSKAARHCSPAVRRRHQRGHVPDDGAGHQRAARQAWRAARGSLRSTPTRSRHR